MRNERRTGAVLWHRTGSTNIVASSVRCLFQPALRRPRRRTVVSVKVTVREGESIEDSLKRFHSLVRRYGPPGTDAKQPKWHKNQLTFYLKPSERRRRDEIRDAFETYAGECARRRLVCVIRRKTKRRKAHFGNAPVVGKYP